MSKLIDLIGLTNMANDIRDWVNAHFLRKEEVPAGSTPYDSNPQMDGTASAGSSNAFARGDHRHPSDTSKVDKVDGKWLSTNDYDATAKAKVDAIPSNPKCTDTTYEAGDGISIENNVISATGGGGSVTVDNELSSSSENPVQNKVIKAALDGKANTSAIPDVSGKYDTTDTAETTIDDADYVPFYDISATAKRKTLWSNIKAKLKAYFDTIYLTSHQDISGKADKATTLAGYGITDAKIENGAITLGSNTITPLTSHQSLSDYVQKSQTAGLLKNDGTVDTNTYLTQHQSLSGYAKYVLCADEAAYNAISPKQSDTLYLIPES